MWHFANKTSNELQRKVIVHDAEIIQFSLLH